MQLRDCDRILREHAQSRRNLREELEASRLIQMAKFQARLDQHKERLANEEARNQELHIKKREMERKILQWACTQQSLHVPSLFVYMQGRQREFIGYRAYGTVSQRCCWSSKKVICLYKYASCTWLILNYSLALEKLRVHLKTKEKISERKRRKFEAVQRKYLQAVQLNVDSSSAKEALQNFLNQRKEVAMEIDTRGLEEERRKAEEDLAKVFS